LIATRRLTTGLALVLLTSVALGGAFGASAAAARETATGDYLAGQQALYDLHTSDAARLLGEASQEDAENPLIVSRAIVALAADGRIEDAAKMARHMLELDPKDEISHLIIGAVDLQNGEFPAAANELKDIGTDSFPGLTGTILHAWALVGENKLDAAEDLLAEMSDQGLADFLVFHRALMADVAGNTELALQLAQAAYDADPGVARLVEAYSRMLGNAGEFDEADKIIGQFESTGASHPLVDVVKEKLAKKEKPGPFAATPQAGAAEMVHSIGIALSRDQSADLAAMFLRLGMYLDPNSHIIAMSLGELLDAHDQHQSADALYEAIPDSSAMKPLATVRVAENLDAMGNRPEAIARLNEIIDNRPKDLDAVSVLGDLYRDDEQYQKAIDAYTKALAITGGDSVGDWRFYYVRGIAYERSKQWPKAEADFLEALKLNPDQPQVLNYLGYSWVDQGMNLDEALDMIQKAVSASPNDGYIIDSLGWAFYRLGRYDQATQVLEQAVQLLPNDPEINDHLGDAYWRTGRKLEAKFQWTIAQSVDTKGDVTKRVLPKLALGLDAAPADKDSAPVGEATPAVTTTTTTTVQ
jgi:tetratricopeptide (TPR) repeat protein